MNELCTYMVAKEDARKLREPMQKITVSDQRDQRGCIAVVCVVAQRNTQKAPSRSHRHVCVSMMARFSLMSTVRTCIFLFFVFNAAVPQISCGRESPLRNSNSYTPQTAPHYTNQRPHRPFHQATIWQWQRPNQHHFYVLLVLNPTDRRTTERSTFSLQREAETLHEYQ